MFDARLLRHCVQNALKIRCNTSPAYCRPTNSIKNECVIKYLLTESRLSKTQSLNMMFCKYLLVFLGIMKHNFKKFRQYLIEIKVLICLLAYLHLHIIHSIFHIADLHLEKCNSLKSHFATFLQRHFLLFWTKNIMAKYCPLNLKHSLHISVVIMLT